MRFSRAGNWWFGVSLPGRRNWRVFGHANLMIGLGPWIVSITTQRKP